MQTMHMSASEYREMCRGQQVSAKTKTKSIKARGRVPVAGQTYKDGEMNKTESAYAHHLEMRKRAGEIVDYQFEAITLRLAKNTSYKPDFVVILADGGIEIHEVKGFWQDDARVKIKVAADKFPWLKFIAVRLVKKQWMVEEF